MGQTERERERRLAFRRLLERMAAALDRRIQPEYADAMWEAFGSESLELFKEATKRVSLLKVARELPSPLEIENVLGDVKREEAARGKQGVPFYCPLCSGQGLVPVRVILEEGLMGTLAYRCSCQNGEQFKDRFPLPPAPPFEEPPAILPKVAIKDLEDYSPERIFEQGAEVEKKCSRCNVRYIVRHAGRVTAGWLLMVYRARERDMCEPCFIKLGKERGLWK